MILMRDYLPIWFSRVISGSLRIIPDCKFVIDCLGVMLLDCIKRGSLSRKSKQESRGKCLVPSSLCHRLAIASLSPRCTPTAYALVSFSLVWCLSPSPIPPHGCMPITHKCEVEVWTRLNLKSKVSQLYQWRTFVGITKSNFPQPASSS